MHIPTTYAVPTSVGSREFRDNRSRNVSFEDAMNTFRIVKFVLEEIPL